MPPRKLYRGNLRSEHKPAHSKALRTARHLLAEGNRTNPDPPPAPKAPTNPLNNEAKRRLKRMVARELAELEQEGDIK